MSSAEEWDFEDLPDSIRSDFKVLHEEMVWLHGNWKLFGQLFREGESRRELLHETAGTFFAQVNKIMIDDVILTVSKLLDPLRTAGNENLVLERLITGLDDDHETLREDLQDQLSDLKQVCEPLDTYRNKHLAHLDRDVELGDADPPSVLVETIDEALDRVSSFMNTVQGHFEGAKTAYDGFLMTHDADSLVATLKRGYEYAEAEHDDNPPDRRVLWQRLQESKFSDA
jgi:DNA-directed RNA polymerase subunit L